ILKMGLTQKNDTLVQQGWRIAEKNQAKIYELVMDMLSYSKDREPAAEPTDINRVVRDVIELLAGRTKELNIEITMNLQEQFPIAAVDPKGLHRALLNIVGNAMDALEGQEERRIVVGTRAEANEGFVRIVVVDNGPGIPSDRIGDIFKPFFST